MAGDTLVRCLWAAGFPLFADPVRPPHLIVLLVIR
jgi:hypothetical protein